MFKAKANVLLLLLHASHHTTILNPIYVCKLFLDIVQDKVKRVTILSMSTGSFQMYISQLLSLGMVTRLCRPWPWPWPCRSRPVNGKAKALSAKAKAKTAKAHSAKAKAAISSP